MALPSPSEFQPYRRVQGQAEGDLARILEITARLIKRRIAALKLGVGGDVRGAQLRLTLAAIRKLQRELWRGVIDPMIAQGIEDAQKAGESAVEALTRVAYASLSEAAAEELVRSLRASAASGIKSDAARRKRDLSRRVYHQEALAAGKIEDIIRSGLVANLSAKELADEVYKYVSPSAPGGQSYSAQRLARTEINNAFHERQVAGATRPGVTGVKWNLSGSHKVPDECNQYAAASPYPPTDIPDKPHPNCFCFLTYETMPREKFKEALESGKFDDEIERRTRENMARLGQKVGKTTTATVLPKTQAVAMQKFKSGMTRDEWSAAGANINAIDALVKKKLIVRKGVKMVRILGEMTERITYRLP